MPNRGPASNTCSTLRGLFQPSLAYSIHAVSLDRSVLRLDDGGGSFEGTSNEIRVFPLP